ncbi:hypothetical protein ACLK1T_04055 [Escherichia coli]
MSWSGLAIRRIRLSGRSPENDAGRCASVAVNHHDDQPPRFSDVPNLTSLCYNAPLTPQGSAPWQLSHRITRLILLFTSGSTGRPKG